MRYLIALMCVIAAAHGNCQDAKKSTFQGNLPQVLLAVDQTFHVPVLGELVEPVPSNVSIQISSTSTVSDILSAVVSQCPGYMLVDTNGVYIVAQKQLFADPANPMNQVVSSFHIPGNLEQFKLTFPGAVTKAEQNISGAGGFINGLGSGKQGTPTPLTQREVYKQSARQILIDVAQEVGNLYSVLILPNTHPEKERRENRDFSGWEIAGGASVSHYRPFQKGYPHS